MTKKESNPTPINAKKPPAPPAPPPKRIIKEDDYKRDTKNEKTTITLEDNEAALVMDSDGNVSIYFPYMDDDADVPDHIQFVSALASVGTTDQEVMDLIWKKFYETVDEVN